MNKLREKKTYTLASTTVELLQKIAEKEQRKLSNVLDMAVAAYAKTLDVSTD